MTDTHNGRLARMDYERARERLHAVARKIGDAVRPCRTCGGYGFHIRECEYRYGQRDDCRACKRTGITLTVPEHAQELRDALAAVAEAQRPGEEAP